MTASRSAPTSSRRACHPGRSSRQPHQVAKATSTALVPRRSSRATAEPSTSGSASSGAGPPARASRRWWRAAPRATTPPSRSTTTGRSRARATAARSTPAPSPAGSTRDRSRTGTHTSPRHSPSGLRSQPVAVSRSAGATSTRPRSSTVASTSATPPSSTVMVSMCSLLSRVTPGRSAPYGRRVATPRPARFMPGAPTTTSGRPGRPPGPRRPGCR